MSQNFTLSKRNIFRIVVLLAAISLLVWLLDNIGWQKIGSYASRLSLTGILVILLLTVAEHILDGMAFYKSITEKVSFFYVHTVNQCGGFVGYFIPWEAGEVVKGALLRQRVSAEAAISGTIVWNYFFKLTKPAAALIAAVIAWIFGPAQFKDLSLWLILASLASLVPWFGLRLFLRIGIAGSFVWLLRLIRVLRKDPQKMIESAQKIDRVVKDFAKDNRSAYYQILIYQIGARAASWLCLYVIMWLLGLQFDLITSAMLWTGFAIMTYLVALLPAKLGTTEAGGLLLFKMMGLKPADGFMTQIIVTLKSILVTSVWSLFIYFLREKPNSNRAQEPGGGVGGQMQKSHRVAGNHTADRTVTGQKPGGGVGGQVQEVS